MGEELTARVAKRILDRLVEKYDYIDISWYGGDDSDRYDDEQWREVARVAAEAAVEEFAPSD